MLNVTNWTLNYKITDVPFFEIDNTTFFTFYLFEDSNTTGPFDINITTDYSVTRTIKQDLWRDIPLGCVLTVLSLLTFVGNAMVLYAVRTERRLQTVSNMYIVSLAIADLIVGIFVMPVSAIYIFTDRWNFGVGLCQLWISVDYIASTASIFNLFILSVDRYCSVKSPLKYIRKRTKKRALLMISFVWSLSSLWVIPIVGWHYFVFNGIRTVPPDVCETEYAKNSVFKVVTAFFNFYLPLTIMICLYGKVFHEIRKRSVLELGQRHAPKIIPAVQFLPSVDSQTLEDSSENNVTTTALKEEAKIHYSSSFISISNNPYPKSIYSSRRRNNVIPKPYQKLHVTEFNTRYLPKRRIEYIYDEGVFDSTTEKIERYYYKKQTNGSIVNNDSSCDLQNDQLSNCRTPSGSSSSEDRISNRSIDQPNPKGKNHVYSLSNGIKQIRKATNIIDHTVTMSQKNGQMNGKNRLNISNDDAHRRISKLLNIGNRIKNIRRSSSLTKEIKAARQLGVIMGAFTICFLPYFILFLVVAFCDGCIAPGLLTAMTWIGYLNSTLNPFLYPLCNTNFRRKFRKMLGLTGRSRPRCDANNTERNSFTMRYD